VQVWNGEQSEAGVSISIYLFEVRAETGLLRTVVAGSGCFHAAVKGDRLLEFDALRGLRVFRLSGAGVILLCGILITECCALDNLTASFRGGQISKVAEAPV
jgi:hypothetical protein